MIDLPPRFTILIDGNCPLCRHEARMMERLDRGRGHLAVIDITGTDFDPGRYGKTMDELMGFIHGVLPNGRVVTGVEVFRRAYGAVGLGWLVAPTAWPGLRWIFDRVYIWFAKNRLRLTGRKCDDGTCRV